MKLKQSQGRGRPVSITDSAMTKLGMAFSYGCNLKESREIAGMSNDAYFRFLRRQPEFRERFKHLQEGLIMKASAVAAEAIFDGDVAVSRWHLERKGMDEFGPPSWKKKGVPTEYVEKMTDEEVVIQLTSMAKS